MAETSLAEIKKFYNQNRFVSRCVSQANQRRRTTRKNEKVEWR